MTCLEDLFDIVYKPHVKLYEYINSDNYDEFLNEALTYRNFILGIDYKIPRIKCRVKTVDSIKEKIERLHEVLPAFMIFNDILAYKIVSDDVHEFDNYADFSYPMNTNGYRANHLYILNIENTFPIEVQVATKYDSVYNEWNRKYVYKTENNFGVQLRKLYDDGLIHTEKEFCRELKRLKRIHASAIV